jgi:muramoyltetrapeptide carboxypeptidase
MLTNLKLSGKLDYIKGIVIGQFINMTQGSDKTLEEIISEKVAGLNIPVMYGLQSGHDTRNLALYLGRNIKLEVDDETSTITFK